MSDRKPHDWVPPEVEGSGRKGGDRLPILRTPSEINEFIEVYNNASSSKEVQQHFGWDKYRYDAVVRTLRRNGAELKAFKKGRPVGGKNKPGAKVGYKAPPVVIPAESLMIQQRVEESQPEQPLPVLKRYENELSGDAATVEKKQNFAAAFVSNNLSVKATCASMGVSTATYYKWLREDPGFSAMVRQACQEISDEAVSVGVSLAFGTHPKAERPDASMVRWVAEKMNPDRFGKEVRHVHSGTIGHTALQTMSSEQKRAELERLLALHNATTIEV